MPSWQSRMLQLFIRFRMKSRIQATEAEIVAYGRKHFGDRRLAARLTPKDVNIHPVNENGIKGEWVWWEGQTDNHVIFYLHGGGYIACSPEVYRPFTAELARQTKARVFALDYRLAPEHRFPAPVEDATNAYRWLLEQGVDPGKMVIGGDSAGGGLTVATLVALRDEESTPLPALAFCFSPWTDLASTGPSYVTNDRRDPMFYGETFKPTAEIYLNGAPTTHPLASPMYADLTGLPPLHAFVSNTEVLFDDAIGLIEKAERCGVQARLHIADRQPHVWPIFVGMIPEAPHTIGEVAELIERQVKLKKLGQVVSPFPGMERLSA
ncbi:MAG: alpha/beta hydrolase [Acidobacteria bacterium]|nr:alpha/beta hydrolase [Acidobacteriota bacterium]